MTQPAFSLLPLPLLLLLFISGEIPRSIGQRSPGVGINYGQIANNLPTPSRVATLLQSIRINRVKLYDSDPNVLQAFAGSDVQFTIGLGNELLPSMTDPSNARDWIRTNVQPYINRTRITSINVGNEILTGNDTRLISSLLPAMRSVYSTLDGLGLSSQVSVSSANSVGILSSSYPPSSGAFRKDLAQYIQPLLNFHSQIKSPFLINAYPFFAYMGDPSGISLDYVLFRNSPGMTDPNTNLHYDNMLYAQIDAVYSAIRAMGHTDIVVKISETGWPSKGDPNEVGATPENAAAYNGNLMKRVAMKQGTPAKPDTPVDVYVFALFNENMKTGPSSERNYGLYYPNGSQVYDVGLQGSHLPRLYSSGSYINHGVSRTKTRVMCSLLLDIALSESYRYRSKIIISIIMTLLLM